MKRIHERKNDKKFNSIIEKVHEEMENAKKRVGSWNLKSKETYSDVYCYDLQFLSEDDIDLLQSKYDLMYDLSRYWDDSKREGQAIERVKIEDYYGEEYVCEFRKLDWILSNNRIIRGFSFVNTGEISYSQMKRKRNGCDQSYDYCAVYNVNDNHLFLRIVNNSDDICFINSDFRQYSFENKVIAEDENSITLIENKDEQSRLEIEVDISGKVVRKYLSLGGYSYVMEGSDVVSAFVLEQELEIDADMLAMVTYAINQFEIGHIDDDKLFDYVNSIKTKVINAIKGIKGDVPMDGLLKRLYIALSMISTKRLVSVEEKRELKKKK